MAGAQVLKIDRCEPAALKTAFANEVTLHGPNLEHADLWASFPATIERLDEKVPRFRITTDFTGRGALRAHSERGSSNWLFIDIGGSDENIVACEKRGEIGAAQTLELPVTLEGKTLPQSPTFYRFEARTGQAPVVARGQVDEMDVEARRESARDCDHELLGIGTWRHGTDGCGQRSRHHDPGAGRQVDDLQSALRVGVCVFQTIIQRKAVKALVAWF